MEISTIKFSTFDQIFTNIPNDKIRIIYLYDNNHRKILHQYLDHNYPKLYKTSLKCKYFDSKELNTFIKCYNCGYKNVVIDDYHYGSLENNKDESISGDCPKCHEHISFEPNYDDWDDVRRIQSNNIIAFGNWFKHYTKPNHAAIPKNFSKEEINNLLNGRIIYEIQISDQTFDKNNLSEYIYEQIKLNNHTILKI